MFSKNNKYLFLSIVIIAAGAFFFYYKKKKIDLTPAAPITIPEISLQKTLAVSKAYFTDMEDPDPLLWMGAKSPEKFISGQFSNKLSAQTDFGITFSVKGFAIPGHDKIKQGRISFQLFCVQPLKKASIVYSVTGAGEKVFEYFQEAISGKANAWNYTEFIVPINSHSWGADAIMKIYAWNEGKEVFYMDDIKIEFLSEDNIPVVANTGPKQNFLYDFEPVSGIPAQGNVSSVRAHSGAYSILLSGSDTYSENIIKKFSEVATDTVTFISTSAWIYTEDDDPVVALVVALENKDGKSITWQGKATDKMHFKKKKWHKINFRADLREVKPSPDDVSKVYLWNKKGGEVYFDDLEIVYGDVPKPAGGNVAVYVSMSGDINQPPVKNKPPFISSIFSEVAGSLPHSVYIIDEEGKKEGELNPGYPMLSGNFCGHANLQDDILIAGPKSMSLYSWCSSTKKYVSLLDENAKVSLKGKAILQGHFDNPSQDDVLLIDTIFNSKMELIHFSKFPNNCTEATEKAKLEHFFFDNPGINANTNKSKIIVGNFSGNENQEILAFSAEGNWNLIERKKNGFYITASGILTRGIILSVHGIKMGTGYDKVIVFSERDSKTDYCLVEFNSTINSCSVTELKDKSFLNFYNSESVLFSGNYVRSTSQELFYLNNTWRFDLKKVKLTIDGLTIESNVDFSQADPARNPKYYEYTKIISGNFFGTGIANFLVIMRNCLDADFDGSHCNEFEEVKGMPSGYTIYQYQTGE